MNKTRIILASQSERRRALLTKMGYTFEVMEPCVDEAFIEGNSPEVEAMRLAVLKAEYVMNQTRQGGPGIVIGADTLVANNGEMLGKPLDRADAVKMLTGLSGGRHRVITGICVIDTRISRRVVDAVTTYVHMRPMTPAQIQEYVDSGEADGKAGAYAIQETADRYVEKTEGSWTNIVGLPTERLAEILKEMMNDDN